MNWPDTGNDEYYDEESFRPNKGERKGMSRRSRRVTKHQLKDFLFDSDDNQQQEEECEDSDNQQQV